MVGLLAVGATLLTPFSNAQGATHDTTLTLDIPGPFTGCGYFSAATNESVRAVMDLVRPSAFTTTQYGQLTGANGPVTSAELTSLTPQTVVYTLAPGWTWSNGQAFGAADLLDWYRAAKTERSPLADGYRAIGSLTADAATGQVTAVFDQPFANWDSLFRDVGAAGTPLTCTFASLARQPSLGPYTLASMTATQAILERDPTWLGPRGRFARIVVNATAAATPVPATPVVDYLYAPATEQVAALSGNPSLAGHVGLSDQLVTVGFSPQSAVTHQLAVRQFLALAIDRQALINRVAGPISFTPGLADSVIYTQGVSVYPGVPGLGPYGQSAVVPATTVPTTAGTDCVACAAPILEAAGYRQTVAGWRHGSGPPLALRVASGPSSVDQTVAADVIDQWRAAGVVVTEASEPTDAAAAAAVRSGQVDAAILTEVVTPQPFASARNWTGTDFGGGYDFGWRSPLIDQWYAAAQDSFNPDDAKGDYADIDQYITTEEWARPLFTLPSVLMWTANLAGVYSSNSLTGLVDQAPTWGLEPHKH